MKRIAFVFLISLTTIGLFPFNSNAQAPQVVKREPPYKKATGWPPLDLLMPDSSKFTKDNLRKQSTLIMFFSPDCDHCIHQMEDMNKRMKELSKYQIILVTHQPMDMLVDFIGKYKLSQHANIKAGQDYKFLLPGFFAMKSLPYFALYSKEGKLITTFESNTEVNKIVKAFEKKAS